MATAASAKRMAGSRLKQCFMELRLDVSPDQGQRSESRCNRGLPDAAWTEVNDGDAGGSPGGAASAGRQCRGYRLG